MTKITFFCLAVLAIISNSNVNAQIPNPSFENWTTTNGIQRPDGWQTMDGLGEMPNSITAFHPGANSPTAAKMTVMTFSGKPWCSMMQTRFKYTTRPAAISFYIKTNNASNDTIILSTYLYKTGGVPVGAGDVEIHDNITDYAELAVKIDYIDTINIINPDSGYFYIGFENNTLHTGNEFYIDGMLSRDSWGGVNEINKVMFTLGNLTPIPADNILNIPVNVSIPAELTIQVYDITGRKLKSLKFNTIKGNNNIRLDVKDLNNGIYLITVLPEEGYKITKKCIINHN